MPYTNDKTVPRNSSEKARKIAGATSIRPLAERGACQIKRGGGPKDPSWAKLRTWKPIHTHRPCISPLYNGAVRKRNPAVVCVGVSSSKLCPQGPLRGVGMRYKNPNQATNRPNPTPPQRYTPERKENADQYINVRLAKALTSGH